MTATELVLRQENLHLKERLRVFEENPQPANFYLSGDTRFTTIDEHLTLLPLFLRLAVTSAGFKQVAQVNIDREIGFYAEQSHWRELSLFGKAQWIDFMLDQFRTKLIESLRSDSSELKVRI